MILPDFLSPGCRIGVTAPSHPIDDETDKKRFEHGAYQLEQMGYEVVFTPDVFKEADRFGRSASGKGKAGEFMDLVRDDSVKAIYSAAGGDFLAEMLPYVDLNECRAHPKWVQGYSDNASLLYYLTTKGDMATAYGANFSDFGMDPWDLSVSRGLEVLEGKCDFQRSFETYQDGFGSRETGFEGYSPDKKVRWKCINKGYDPRRAAFMKGRLLGGCMDVLLNLSGTPYDGTIDFIEKYKDDNIIWYLESFDLHFEQMMEGLWKMKEMGWFRHTAGFVFGRPLFYPEQAWDGSMLPTYEAVLRERLSYLKVPIITGADIGHKGPQFVMINGALAKVRCFKGRGSVEYIGI